MPAGRSRALCLVGYPGFASGGADPMGSPAIAVRRSRDSGHAFVRDNVAALSCLGRCLPHARVPGGPLSRSPAARRAPATRAGHAATGPAPALSRGPACLRDLGPCLGACRGAAWRAAVRLGVGRRVAVGRRVPRGRSSRHRGTQVWRLPEAEDRRAGARGAVGQPRPFPAPAGGRRQPGRAPARGGWL